MLVKIIYQLMPDFPAIPHRPSLIEHAAKTLRDALMLGTWGGHLPGERTLSEQLNVSRPTLRAALLLLGSEGWFKVEQGRRRAIVTPPFKAGLRTPKTIALLSPLSLADLVPFAQVWTDCLREFLSKAGYELQIHRGSRWWHSASPQRELGALTEQKPAAVWVVFSGTERIQRWFVENSISCVTSGSAHVGVRLPSVDLNHRATCRHAAGQFLSAGHERVVFMRQGPSNAGDFESERGFFEGFRSKSGAHPWVAEHDGTPAGIQRKLDSVLRTTPRTTGFLVTHAMQALMVASELLRRGIQLPRDASIICRDTDLFLEYFSPRIARYRVDPQLHAQRLGRLVLQCASGGAPKTGAIRLVPQFYPGESIGSFHSRGKG
jgi:DNA-binding LacI/PurR family transcriptional regulator